MQAFIAITLLVASVAAQSSLGDLRVNKEHLLKFQRPLTGQIYGQEKYGKIPDFTVRDYEVPTYDRVNHDQVSILSMEQIYSTELFQQYLTLPLFREYLQYPVFQQYIASPLFQKFWTSPLFQSYFKNPYLFQKYILPQVQYYTQMYGQNTFTTRALDSNVFDRFRGINTDLYQKNMYGDLTYGNRALVRDDINLDTIKGIEGLTTLPYATGYYPQVDNVNYKFLLDKIYRTLFVNKPEGKITEVKTDVKVLPGTHVEEQTVGKFINPITGEAKIALGDVKIVDEKIVPVQEHKIVDTIIEDELLKEQLLKKLYLSKVLGKKVFTPEELKHIKNLPLIEEEFNRLRRNTPAGLFKINGEQEMVNPMYASMYAHQGKDMYKTLEAEKLSYFNQPMYKKYTNPMYTMVQQPKEYTLEDKYRMYNPMLNFNKYQKDSLIGQDKVHMFDTLNFNKDIKNIQYQFPQTTENQMFHSLPLTYGTPVGSGMTTFNPLYNYYNSQIKA